MQWFVAAHCCSGTIIHIFAGYAKISDEILTCSGKMLLLDRMLPAILERGHKVGTERLLVKLVNYCCIISNKAAREGLEEVRTCHAIITSEMPLRCTYLRTRTSFALIEIVNCRALCNNSAFYCPIFTKLSLDTL